MVIFHSYVGFPQKYGYRQSVDHPFQRWNFGSQLPAILGRWNSQNGEAALAQDSEDALAQDSESEKKAKKAKDSKGKKHKAGKLRANQFGEQSCDGT